MLRSIIKNAILIKYLILFYAGFMVGRHIGFRDGVEFVSFDRNHANLKLQQCLRIVRGE